MLSRNALPAVCMTRLPFHDRIGKNPGPVGGRARNPAAPVNPHQSTEVMPIWQGPWPHTPRQPFAVPVFLGSRRSTTSSSACEAKVDGYRVLSIPHGGTYTGERTVHDSTTRLLGRILGEVYRIQNAIDGMSAGGGPAQVYGLLNGFEEAIDAELECANGISNEKLSAFADALEPIFHDPEELKNFRGYYQIEKQLSQRGISRTDAIQILTYWKSDGRFVDIIEKMNSSGSPVECKTFELRDYEK